MDEGPRIKIVDVAELGLIDDVKKLIAAGYDVNEKSEFGNYAVIAAASRNDVEMLKILKEAGANMRVFNDEGQSTLTWANSFRNEEMINLINSTRTPRP